MSAAIKCDKFRKLIGDGIKRANANATSNAQRVSEWRFLDRDLSMAQGDLTPTLKLKRGEVNKKYADLIDAIYEASEGKTD